MRHHHTAQGLASLGRHGDSVLVHMSPEEVRGLDALARMQGTKLTINPETGMPEAFSLGGFLGGLLPTIGGIAASAMFPEASPWLIGTIAGVGTTLATGNPLAGIMTGLGVGGGMGIGKGIFNVGEKLGDMAGSQVAESVAQNEAAKLSSAAAAGQNVSPYTTQVANYTGATSPYTNSAFNTATMQAPTSAVVGQNLNTFNAGLKESFNNPAALVNELGGGTNTAIKLGTPIMGAALKGIEPSDLGYGTNKGYYDPDTGKWVGPEGQLNLSADTGLRLYKEGGEIQKFGIGGSVSNSTAGSGITGLYGTPDGMTSYDISQDGYGIGRLNNLAQQQSTDQAKVLGYADGGKIGEITDASNLNNLPTLNLNTGQQSNNIPGMAGIMNLFGRHNPEMARTFMTPTIGSSKNNINPLYMMNGLFSYNIDPAGKTSGKSYKEYMDTILNPQPATLPTVAAAPTTIKPSSVGYPTGPDYAATKPTPYGTYALARGGYLDGQGDGMSDSIPATIEGKQPARLADGEFVVPADVVSHLGNGSSKAGSKKLYAMLHKVRKARTGSPKQGKQINPDSYLPA